MEVPSHGFEKLYRTLVNNAARALEQSSPQYVKTFREALKSSHDPEYAQNAVADIQAGSQFNKWRELCIDLVDVELQMNKVRNSLALLDSQDTASLSQGEWVEYHFCAWAVFMQGLLYRIEKLAKDISRKLIRPIDPEWKSIESGALQEIYDLKLKMQKIRDPVAHTGGAVEALAEKHRIELHVLIGGIKDMTAVLEPMAAFQRRWYERLSVFSDLVFGAIDRLGEYLNTNLTRGK